MGGANKVARLATSLVAIAGCWGVTDVQVGAADEWRSRVSAKLLSIYDAPAAARPATVPNQASELGSNATALDPRFNERGWVQADVRYDCSQDTPAKALASAGLATSSSIKLAPLCVVE